MCIYIDVCMGCIYAHIYLTNTYQVWYTCIDIFYIYQMFMQYIYMYQIYVKCIYVYKYLNIDAYNILYKIYACVDMYVYMCVDIYLFVYTHTKSCYK